MARPYRPEQHISIMIPTPDDWYPNFANGMVRLTYVGRLPNRKYRIAVCGDDDYMLLFDANDKTTAKVLFNKLKAKPSITQKELIDLGFSCF